MKAGIDIGSRSIKIYYESGGKPIRKKFDTVRFFKDYLHKKGDKYDIGYKSLFDGQIPDILVATGYGKLATNLNVTKTVSEIIAHATGAVKFSKNKNMTLIDIGGQDTKVINIEGGHVADFYMNNKCAAGSGRYIENMANVLGVSLDDISKMRDNPIRIDSTCATFGESEVLSKLFEGIPVPEIGAGINLAVVKRLIPIILRYNNENIYISGGVAKNEAVVRFLSHELKKTVKIIDFPDFNGAYGCYNYE